MVKGSADSYKSDELQKPKKPKKIKKSNLKLKKKIKEKEIFDDK